MNSTGFKTAGALALGCALLSCTFSYNENEAPPAGPMAGIEEASLKAGNEAPEVRKREASLPRRFPAYSTFVNIARKATPAVVQIRTTGRGVAHREMGPPENPLEQWFERFRKAPPRETRPRQSVGSGFLVEPDGTLLTNYHVIEGADSIRVKLADEREWDAEVLASDEAEDLALLRLHADEPLPVCPLGDSSRIEAGEWAIAVGSPFGLAHSVTVGVISATGRRGLYNQVGFIQTDAPINYGNSGGPLLNIRGEAVGINTAMMSKADGIGFAVPINRAREFIQSQGVIQ